MDNLPFKREGRIAKQQDIGCDLIAKAGAHFACAVLDERSSCRLDVLFQNVLRPGKLLGPRIDVVGDVSEGILVVASNTGNQIHMVPKARDLNLLVPALAVRNHFVIDDKRRRSNEVHVHAQANGVTGTGIRDLLGA